MPNSAAIPRVMISYRRSDSAGITGRIFDRLAARFGVESVFMDIDAIPLGVDFRDFIGETIKTMDVLLAIIGPDWLGSLSDGTSRFDDPEDPVRVEIETAARSGLRIVPVLVEDAKMPARDHLPSTLNDVVFLNAATVSSGIDFRHHIERLIDFLMGIHRSYEPEKDVLREPKGNLPKRVSELIGRDREVASLAEILIQARVVTLTGAGGIGKTRTAIEVARSLQPALADGAWFVDLAPIRDDALIAHETGLTLGVEQAPNKDVLAGIIEFLKRRALLVVFDNCEHIVAGAAATVDAIVAQCPGIMILTTSREPLGVEGERVFRLSSLSVPVKDEAWCARDAKSFSALALFAERASAANADFVLTPGNAEIIADICRQLDGIALAIELAAARVNTLSPHEIRGRLNERFRVLADGRRTAVPRQQTMRAAIDWSYELLPSSERVLFARLAIFPGGCTLRAAEWTCAYSEIEQIDVLAGLSSLVRKSLIVAEFGEGETRYRMLESTRAYASEKASESWDTLSERLSTWIDDFTERSMGESRTIPQNSWLAAMKREIDNIRFALTASLSNDAHVRKAARIAHRLAFSMFWYEAGLEAEGRRWVRAALDRIDESREPVLAGRLWSALASNASGREAVAAGRKALDLLEAFGDLHDRAVASTTFAFGLFQLGRIEEAERIARESCSFYESEGLVTDSRYAEVLVVRANILRVLEQDDDAQRDSATALAIFVQNGEGRSAANVKGNLAELEFQNGNTERALHLVYEATEAFRSFGAVSREATGFVNAATYHLELRDVDRGYSCAVRALTLARGSADIPIISVAIQNIAAAMALRGDYKPAAKLIGFVDRWYLSEGMVRQWGEQRIANVIDVLLAGTMPSDELTNLRTSGSFLTVAEAIDEAMATRRLEDSS